MGLALAYAVEAGVALFGAVNAGGTNVLALKFIFSKGFFDASACTFSFSRGLTAAYADAASAAVG